MADIGEVTRSSTTVYEFEWKIQAFSSLSSEANVWYSSPVFSFAGASWQLYLFPNFLSIHNKVGHIGISLKRNSCIPPINLEVSVGFKTSDGKKDIERCTQRLCRNGCETYLNSLCLQRDVLFERQSELLPSDVLTVLCSIKLLKSITDPSDIASPKCSHCKDIVDAENFSSHEQKCVNKPIKCPECSDVILLKNWYNHDCEVTIIEEDTCTSESSTLLHDSKVLYDLKELFLQKEDCDVVLKVKGQDFPAHKAILKARSPVFASTFRNDMKEKATGIVEIDDCDPHSFSDFLLFIYCGDVRIISVENVFDLFIAADKYDVQDLRSKCIKFMKKNLSVDTFCDTISIALMHCETDLIKLATRFFTKNAPKIILTVKWQSFLSENPIQSNELLVKLLAPNSK